MSNAIYIIGPKLYIAHADVLGCGSTVLHSDAADAFNLMTFGLAVWTIFLRKDRKGLSDWLRINKPVTGSPEGSHIHQQATFLTKDNLTKLYNDAQILPFKIVQKRGDMVIIPSGCAHQVEQPTHSVERSNILFRLATSKTLSKWPVTLFTQVASRHALNSPKNSAARTWGTR